MRYATRQIVYPRGDSQEIAWTLRFGEIVGVNGKPLEMPLPTVRMLAYRVRAISTEENQHETITNYVLEQMLPEDLAEFVQHVD